MSDKMWTKKERRKKINWLVTREEKSSQQTIIVNTAGQIITRKCEVDECNYECHENVRKEKKRGKKKKFFFDIFLVKLKRNIH